MLSSKGMKDIFKIIMATALVVLCQGVHAADISEEDSPAIRLLDSNKSTRTLEGVMLRMARPILKKTPMAAIMDDIDMMMLCPVGKGSKKDNDEFEEKLTNVLNGYTLVSEIDDELSHMFIYIHNLSGNSFSELVLYITSPESNMLLFRGDFTIEGLMKVGELSEQDRKTRIKARRDTGQDESFMQYMK